MFDRVPFTTRHLITLGSCLWLAACASAPPPVANGPTPVDAPPTTDDCPPGEQMVCRAGNQKGIQTGQGRVCRCEINRLLY